MSILWAPIAILVILWVLGFSGNMDGGLIHVLLVIAVIFLLCNLFVGLTLRRGQS